MSDETHVTPRLVAVRRPDGIGRRARLRRILVGLLVAAAVAAGLAYTWSRGGEDGGAAIRLVKDQSATGIARADLGSGGTFKVVWSASSMGTSSGADLQMVEATLVSTDGRTTRRATFMVDVDTREVLAQDPFAASLLEPGGATESIHR